MVGKCKVLGLGVSEHDSGYGAVVCPLAMWDVDEESYHTCEKELQEDRSVYIYGRRHLG